MPRYRVLKPLQIHGRIAGCGEVVRLPEHSAAEWVESGHLREVSDAVLVNGEARQWTQPTIREAT
jgi:hypothetical protein